MKIVAAMIATPSDNQEAKATYFFKYAAIADCQWITDSEEKREPVSDINTVVVDSLKVLDPKRPIREADIGKVTALHLP